MPFHERTDGRALRNAAGPNLIDLLAADHVKHRRKRLDPDLERLEGRLLIHGVTVVDRKRWALGDRKSTRLNSSHVASSYAVFCLKKKNAHQHVVQAQSDAHTSDLEQPGHRV